MQPTLVLAMLALAATSYLAVQQKPERFAYPKPEDMQAGMARWMATFKPGPAHERLKELVGDWTVTMRMGGVESQGSAKASWFVQGKWLQIDTQYSAMDQAILHRTTLGYDNFKQRYVASFVDSLQTTLNTASGLFGQSGDDLFLWGTIDEPMTPEQDKQVKYVYRGFGQDKWVLEVHDMMIGESNTKVLEFAYVRKK